MQISRFQQQTSNGSHFTSRISPMRQSGYAHSYISKPTGIEYLNATKQQYRIAPNNYVGGGGVKHQMRPVSISPDSKKKAAFNEKILASNSKQKTNGFDNNSSFTRISDKNQKVTSQPQPSNMSQGATYIRASSVNRYNSRIKYGADSNNHDGYSISFLKENSFFPDQGAIKKSSSLRAGSSVKCPSSGSRVQEHSRQERNSSFHNINCINSKSNNDTSSGLVDLLNQNAMAYIPQNQMNVSQEKAFQNRKSSTHQNPFLQMNNTSNNSSMPSTLNIQQNNQPINSQLFSFHLNPAYIDTFSNEKAQLNNLGDTGAGRSSFSEDNNISTALHSKENDFVQRGNYSQIHQNHLEQNSIQNKKYDQSKQPKNPSVKNQSFNQLYQQPSNQPLKVLHNYQNIPCDIKLDMSAINYKSNQSHPEKYQQENQLEGSYSLQKKGSGMINIPQFINAGASTFSSTAKPNFQSTSKLNNSFNFSKELSLTGNEGSQNIEDMHYYAVDFQQNCKKWLSQIELQF